MKAIIGLLVFAAVILTPLKALAWGLVELGDITFEHGQYLDGNDIYVPNAVNVAHNMLNVDVVMFDSGFFRSSVLQKSFSSSNNIIGFNYQLGTKLTDNIELGWVHTGFQVTGLHDPKYPDSNVDNAIFLRVRLYKGAQPHELW